MSIGCGLYFLLIYWEKKIGFQRPSGSLSPLPFFCCCLLQEIEFSSQQTEVKSLLIHTCVISGSLISLGFLMLQTIFCVCSQCVSLRLKHANTLFLQWIKLSLAGSYLLFLCFSFIFFLSWISYVDFLIKMMLPWYKTGFLVRVNKECIFCRSVSSA